MALSAPMNCVRCHRELGEGPYCGSCGAWNGTGDQPAPSSRRCPVCGASNPATNVHCEECAFRLDREPLATYGPRLRRRTLGIVAGVVLLITFVMIGTGESEDPPEAFATDTSSTTTSTPTPTVQTTLVNEQLAVAEVRASSSFNDRLGPHNLVDGDATTYWNDASAQGVGAELTFVFDEPAIVAEVVVRNVADTTGFTRNYRVRGYEILVGGVPAATGELADTQDPQRITVAMPTTATEVTFRVTSTFAGTAVGDLVAFNELAIAEIEFYGMSS